MKALASKAYELEYLVNTNGDKKRINQLRNELGFKRKQGQKCEFTVDQYIEWKKQGYTDTKIIGILEIHKGSLWRLKVKNGLTAERVKELVNM